MAWELGGGGQGWVVSGPTFQNINLNMPDPMFRLLSVTVASLYASFIYSLFSGGDSRAPGTPVREAARASVNEQPVSWAHTVHSSSVNKRWASCRGPGTSLLPIRETHFLRIFWQNWRENHHVWRESAWGVNMSARGCFLCLKYLVFVVNFLFLILGLAVLLLR
jgi:hypothetical protein